MSKEIVVVVAGGSAPRPEGILPVPLGAPVIAADGGLEHARKLKLEVSVVIGDLDSAPPEAVEEAERAGARIERHAAEKDATDLELALDAALELRPKRILVLMGDGGRLDHLLSALLLFGSERYEAVEIDAYVGPARVHVVRAERALEGEPDELVSLLALHVPAQGVRTEGLVYPLAGETLEPGSSRGVSNVFASRTAHVSLERGVLLVVRPGDEGDGGAP